MVDILGLQQNSRLFSWQNTMEVIGLLWEIWNLKLGFLDFLRGLVEMILKSSSLACLRLKIMIWPTLLEIITVWYLERIMKSVGSFLSFMPRLLVVVVVKVVEV